MEAPISQQWIEELARLIARGQAIGDEDAEAAIQRLLQVARYQLDMDVAFLSEFTGGQRVIRQLACEPGKASLHAGHSDPADATYCKQIVNGTLPQLIRDAGELEALRTNEFTEALDIGSYLGVPVRLDDGSVYGTFCTFSRSPRYDLTDRDLALLTMLADLAAVLVQKSVRRRREDRIRRERIEAVLGGGGMYPVWQPIVEIASGRIVGLESLSRFPREEARSPADWFDDAAAVDMAGALEARAMTNALSILDAAPEDVLVGFNVTARTLEDSRVQAALEGMPLDRIVLELTEHAIVEDYDRLGQLLGPLRARGLRLAVDDAGAGHASFRHILRLRPSFIKLDMSLVRDIDTDVAKRALVAAVEHFARATGSTVTAEGVETAAELEALRELGIGYVQGFFLHKPTPRDATLELLARQHRIQSDH